MITKSRGKLLAVQTEEVEQEVDSSVAERRLVHGIGFNSAAPTWRAGHGLAPPGTSVYNTDFSRTTRSIHQFYSFMI